MTKFSWIFNHDCQPCEFIFSYRSGLAHHPTISAPIIPLFSPRRRLYEPEASIPTFHMGLSPRLLTKVDAEEVTYWAANLNASWSLPTSRAVRGAGIIGHLHLWHRGGANCSQSPENSSSGVSRYVTSMVCLSICLTLSRGLKKSSTSWRVITGNL